MPRARRTIRRGAIVVAFIAALSGCAGTPAIEPDTSAELTGRVSAVSTAVLAGDFAGATALLDELEARVRQALQDSQLTDDRAARIQATIAVVRAELAAAIAAAQPPPAPAEPAPEDPAPAQPEEGGGVVEEPAPVDPGGNEKEKEENKEREKEEEKKQEKEGNGNGNSGNGKGKD